MTDNTINPQLRALLGPQIQQTPMEGGSSLTNGIEEGEDRKSFADTLKESIAEVNQLQNEADNAIDKLVTNEKPDIHGTLIALEKADISFRVLMEVRNKLVNAYQEMMRM